MFRFTSSWIALAVICLLGKQRCEAQFQVLEVPGIFELVFSDSSYPLNNPGVGPHTDFYTGNISTPLQDLQVTFFSTSYTAAEILFDMPNAMILSDSVGSGQVGPDEFDSVSLSVGSTASAGFFGNSEFVSILYSPSQEFHTTFFEVSGMTVSGNPFLATSETIVYVPEPSSVLLLSALGVSAGCRRRRAA